MLIWLKQTYMEYYITSVNNRYIQSVHNVKKDRINEHKDIFFTFLANTLFPLGSLELFLSLILSVPRSRRIQ